MRRIALGAWAAAGLMLGCGQVASPTESVGKATSDEAAAVAAVERGDTAALQRWSGALVLPKWVPVEGRSLTSWTEAWWRWLSRIPADRNPEFDLEGCDFDQPPGVVFLPPYQSPSWTRSCSLVFGKPVLLASQAVMRGVAIARPYNHNDAMAKYKAEHKKNFPNS